MQVMRLLKPFWPVLQRILVRWLAGKINSRRSEAAALQEPAPVAKLKAFEAPVRLAPVEVLEEVEKPRRGTSGYYKLAAGLSLGVFLGVLYVIQKNKTIGPTL